MIISASRRTDIPAFFSEWFERRVREGFLYVRNPMNAHQVSRVSLSPEVVDAIVFWTKNPAPILKRLDAFSAYPYYFQTTLTGYGSDVERCLPDKKNVLIPAFKELSSCVGPTRNIWRYDPILFNKTYSPEYHIHAFECIAEALEGSTEKCVISFVDRYTRNSKALRGLEAYELSEAELNEFAATLAGIAREHGMVVATCAEKIDLSACGIEHNACIDKALLEHIMAGELKVKKDAGQRPECGCMASIDIGSYNTCRHGCVYCYATFNDDMVKRMMAAYDVASPLLCDQLKPDDVVTERKMKKLFVEDKQLKLDI